MKPLISFPIIVVFIICSRLGFAQETTPDMLSDTKDLPIYMDKVLANVSKSWRINRYEKITNLTVITRASNGSPSDVKIDYNYRSMGYLYTGWVELFLSNGIAFYMNFWDKPGKFVYPLMKPGDENSNFDSILLTKIKALQKAFEQDRNLKESEHETLSFEAVVNAQLSIPASRDIGGCLIQKTEVIPGSAPTSHTEWVQGYDSEGNVVASQTSIKDSEGKTSRTVYAIENTCSHAVILRGIAKVEENQKYNFHDASIVIKAGEEATFDYQVKIEPQMGKFKIEDGPGTEYFRFKSTNLTHGSQSEKGNSLYSERAASNVKSQYERGLAAYKAYDYNTARENIAAAAEGGNAKAQELLGRMCDEGEGMNADLAEGFKWYYKAASKGLPLAETKLGFHYQYGQGVAQSLDSAYFWFKKAVAQGNSEAEFDLGILFSRSVEPPDHNEAFSWFFKSANHNNSSGEYLLGWYYYKGVGTAENKTEGIKWMRKAVKDGNYDAKTMLNYLKISLE